MPVKFPLKNQSASQTGSSTAEKQSASEQKASPKTTAIGKHIPSPVARVFVSFVHTRRRQRACSCSATYGHTFDRATSGNSPSQDPGPTELPPSDPEPAPEPETEPEPEPEAPEVPDEPEETTVPEEPEEDDDDETTAPTTRPSSSPTSPTEASDDDDDDDDDEPAPAPPSPPPAPTPRPVLCGNSWRGGAACTSRRVTTSRNAHRTTCSSGHTYWGCNSNADDYHGDRTCVRSGCGETFSKCSNAHRGSNPCRFNPGGWHTD